MDSNRKYAVIVGSLLALCGTSFLFVKTMCRCRNVPVEDSDKDIYEKLQDSKIALDKAAVVIQSALDDMLHQAS